MTLSPISEQVVVVFGASSGIGRATAKLFARRGARVAVAARSEGGLNSLVQEIKNEGGNVLAVVADATQFGQVRSVADRAVEQYGRLGTWVHAAAVSLYATFEETTPEEFEQVIRVNLLGQAYGAWAALPHLRRTGRGALIHVTSVESELTLPYQSAYAASKHGIAGFVDALRMELAHEGVPISVTNILPASINTPLFNHARTKLGVKPKGIPPFYEPEVVARTIVHAAEHPSYEVIVGDAGKLMVSSKRLAPRVTDLALAQIGFQGQKSTEPKSVDSADNLFSPMDRYHQAEGDFGRQSFSVSGLNWFNRQALPVQLAIGAGLGGLAFLVASSTKGDQKRANLLRG